MSGCNLRNLGRCPDCPSRKIQPDEKPKKIVFGTGPLDAEIMSVGEGPGREENNRGLPFIGRAGDEFNQTYLPRAGLDRKQLFVTNTVKCHWADSGDAPPDWLIRSCSNWHLRNELKVVRPRLVLLMGGVANSLMGWDVEREHGMLHVGVDLLGHTCNVYSTHHPALGMHMGNKMQALLDDFAHLKLLFRGKVDPIEVRDSSFGVYERLYVPSQVAATFKNSTRWAIAIDTESKKTWRGFPNTIKYTPDRLTFCIDAPHAFEIRRTDGPAIQEFARLIRRFRRLYMHNAPHDEEALDEMGVWVPHDHVHDTMSMAYHDGRFTSKGLKYLSYKLAGIEMTSFDEVVIPYSYERALEYLVRIKDQVFPLPLQEPVGGSEVRNCKECKGKGYQAVGRGKYREIFECDFCSGGLREYPKMTKRQSLNQSINRIFTDLSKGDVKVWDRWESWTEKEHMIPALLDAINKFGPLPLPSIEYVPDEPAMIYACGDALATRIIGPLIQQRLTAIRRSVRA